jgi:hypothetical protein
MPSPSDKKKKPLSQKQSERASIAIKMLLFIANVSVKRVSCLLLLLMLLWSLAECVWQIDCPLWLSELFFFFLLLRPNAGAFSVPLTFAWWVRTASNAQDSFEFFPFRSVNHHYLSEGACLPPTPPPRRKPESWFFFLLSRLFFSFRSLCHCCVRTRGWRARRRPTRVCARPPVYTHLRKGEREQRKKTFGKLIAGKKEMISRKKKSIQPPRWRGREKKNCSPSSGRREKIHRTVLLPVYERWIHKHF